MTPEETAAATTAAVSGIAANFMLDPATYAKGNEAGFAGLDFYAGGRAGVLGRVDADVVADAFAFFEPESVRTNWEQALSTMEPEEASALFAGCGHDWAREHLGDDVDWDRLAELLGRITDAASAAGAPLFAAWRGVDEPDDAKALALHRFNVLRELRNALHAAAVAEAGLQPVEALLVKTPYMAPVFGWTGDLPDVGEDHRARHARAEAATNRALAPAYATLDDEELDELVALCTSALGAVT
ncbi:MAG: hypothetical protein H0W25_05000 [Acidimicrobiia bacterium]|nr:hypothetical protein [Acidimicrobiia bacterium]